ncbi:MarR family winged helix-turn-helix transcriptional regulator [Pseudoruegeria sp. HB172150]|uniref:MarR family winged helix-turn-helix transcriptional regulator n=1 Tax=Pseudoruegeria sp. HB172150 TaxID=2721164 RepID=UPI001552A650|nr:MarR family transcriptional regulator [Pseudoruegeria sp. HB172150]
MKHDVDPPQLPVEDTPPLDTTAEGLIRRKRSTWPAASTHAGNLVIRLFRMRDLIHDSSRREVKERFGLTRAEFEVVVTLRTLPPPHALTPTELRQSMLITPGGLTKVMRNLDANGLVRRRPSEHDRRSSLIELTEEGVALAEQVLPLALDNYARHIAQGLTPKESERLSELLAKALRSLEAVHDESEDSQ